MLALMVAFIANAVLTFWFDFPGVGVLWGWQSGGGGPLMWFQAALYVVLPLGAVLHVLRTPHTPLRDDARRISDFNIFLVRAAFWAVFLVGLSDAVVSFLRVEGFLPVLFGEKLAIDLGRSEFRGIWVHVPALLIGVAIAARTRPRSLGFIWLSLLVVFAELLIVFSRFIFSYEQAFMGDLVRFWYAALFLFASAYTLLEEGHVRVDVVYAAMPPRVKGVVNAVGAVLLGMSLCWVILAMGMGSRSSIIMAPLLSFEVTQTGFGMYVKYLMAGFLGIFAVSMLIQFAAALLDAVADARGDPGARVRDEEIIH